MKEPANRQGHDHYLSWRSLGYRLTFSMDREEPTDMAECDADFADVAKILEEVFPENARRLNG